MPWIKWLFRRRLKQGNDVSKWKPNNLTTSRCHRLDVVSGMTHLFITHLSLGVQPLMCASNWLKRKTKLSFDCWINAFRFTHTSISLCTISFSWCNRIALPSHETPYSLILYQVMYNLPVCALLYFFAFLWNGLGLKMHTRVFLAEELPEQTWRTDIRVTSKKASAAWSSMHKIHFSTLASCTWSQGHSRR